MSTPFNMPIFEELAGGALFFPLPTYKSLANFSGVKPDIIGERLMFAKLETIPMSLE